jgi:hypothetical protein
MAAVFFLFFLMFSVLLAVASTVFWIWMLVDCVNNKSLSDSTKAVWVLFIVFTHFIGAFFYLIVGRKPEPVMVYPYQQPVPFQQPMGGMYQQGNAPRGSNQFYQPPFPPPPHPTNGAPNMPHTSYYPILQYPPTHRSGNVQGEYIPHEATQKPTTRLYSPPPVTPQPSYQEGYVPQPSPAEEPHTPTQGAPWFREDEPYAIYPDLPQQTQRQQPNHE